MGQSPLCALPSREQVHMSSYSVSDPKTNMSEEASCTLSISDMASVLIADVLSKSYSGVFSSTDITLLNAPFTTVPFIWLKGQSLWLERWCVLDPHVLQGFIAVPLQHLRTQGAACAGTTLGSSDN